MKVLGIETSCDETAASVVTADKKILSNVIRTQISHADFGGVVPELASREHIAFLDTLVKEALAKADCTWADIDAIAVTSGPGLIGGVIVGVMEAKAMASALGKPVIAVNHLEGHALTARLTDDVEFPYLLLLVSGGHSQLLAAHGVGQYQLLGESYDDAVGESFDKLAKLLGLGMPGGPAIERLAASGNESAFVLPRPLVGDGSCNFSFSGLKTAVRRQVESGNWSAEDICAVFQKTVAEILADRVKNAIRLAPCPTIVVAGGVAANQYLKARLENVAAEQGAKLVAPPLKLCTDNAAMIAWAGIENLREGKTSQLDFKPLPRWPLAG